MIEALESRLYRWRALAPWLLVEAVLHGAALVALLLWLSYRYATEGFGGIRQHAFAPAPSRASLAAAAPRKWWTCPCEGACECLATFARELRRCCERLLGRPLAWRAPGHPSRAAAGRPRVTRTPRAESTATPPSSAGRRSR